MVNINVFTVPKQFLSCLVLVLPKCITLYEGQFEIPLRPPIVGKDTCYIYIYIFMVIVVVYSVFKLGHYIVHTYLSSYLPFRSTYLGTYIFYIILNWEK